MKTLVKSFLPILFIGLIACSSNNTSSAQEQIIEDLAPAAFQSKSVETGGLILDVRTPSEVAEGVIEGAIVINIQDQDFATRIAALDKGTPVFVYCKAGGRSARASGMLEKLGFEQVYNLDGGITAWRAAGLPTLVEE